MDNSIMIQFATLATLYAKGILLEEDLKKIGDISGSTNSIEKIKIAAEAIKSGKKLKFVGQTD